MVQVDDGACLLVNAVHLCPLRLYHLHTLLLLIHLLHGVLQVRGVRMFGHGHLACILLIHDHLHILGVQSQISVLN